VDDRCVRLRGLTVEERGHDIQGRHHHRRLRLDLRHAPARQRGLRGL